MLDSAPATARARLEGLPQSERPPADVTFDAGVWTPRPAACLSIAERVLAARSGLDVAWADDAECELENGRWDDPIVRQELTQAYVTLEILRYNQLRMLTALSQDGVPGPEASIGKLYWASWHRHLGELWMLVRGASGMVAEGGGYAGHDGEQYALDRQQRTFLYSRAHTIYGGSNQVQRNVIGERVLGLPKEPR